MRQLLLVLLLTICTGVLAQSAEKLYEEGKKLYDAKNYTAAVPKLQTAAEKGHKKAQYRLGRCYDKGHGVEKNDEKAYEWYLKSAKQGSAKAQYQVGKCLKNGTGVEKDRKKAVEWFVKAAKQDNGDGQLALGKAYLKGKGIAADADKAKSWLKKAVNNPKDGKEILEELRKEKAEGDEDAVRILEIVGKN
ncbi:MAG: sel1 repeat family protein [Prevotella sp.]|nr:sel1 repeat family protein [Prevotella sp.]